MNLLVPSMADSDDHLYPYNFINNKLWPRLHKITVNCYVRPCCFVNWHLCFGVTVCLLPQERRGTFLIILYFCLPVTFPFLCSGYSSKYFIHPTDSHLVNRKRPASNLRTKNMLVAVNGATHLHLQSTHFHLFNWWFYGTALCLLSSQWANCGSQSLNHGTQLLLTKPVRRWRRLNHVIYCSYKTFINNGLCLALRRQLTLFCSTTRPVRRLDVSVVTLQ